MPLSEGTRLGSYDILAPLGAGGMGEVYRATDRKLKRQVAIKILPPMLAADPDRLARFQREAEVLASLNHPQIATIYGFEDVGDVKALVMELVEGPTLADRIAQGPISIEEALPIARQIAEALEAAHEQGIIHRDLKPANIKVRDDGAVKVLDFGLAKALAPAEAGALNMSSEGPGFSPGMNSPTITTPAMTAAGLILGTAAYMSPEQARGKPVDKRADVWAFGALLYEMLTGTRAFEGEDVAELIASVMKTTPDWTRLAADVPPQVVTLIQRCLEKDRKARIGDIAVARFLLSDHATLAASRIAIAPAATVRRSLSRQPLLWVVVGLLAGLLIGPFVARRGASVASLTHLQMNVSPADHLITSSSIRPSRTAVAISPDGRTVVFNAMRGEVPQLYVRALDRDEATPLAGTERAVSPFLSPDGAWIGFLADNKIKKVAITGGPTAPICDLPGAETGPIRLYGASWAEDGTIFFATIVGIFKVASSGGAPIGVTTPDAAKGERHLLPHALPGGNALLFTSVIATDWSTANVVVHSLDSGDRRVVVPGGTDARYLRTGHLAFMQNGVLMAVPFDAKSREITGAPVALIDNVMHGIIAPNSGDETGAGQFAVSSSGSLLYLAGGIGRRVQASLTWVDRKGAETPLGSVPTGPYLFPRLSPDGQRLAMIVVSGAPDLWMYDVLRGVPTRLTFDGSTWPLWSPDGRRLVYSASTTGVRNLHLISADGSGKPQRLLTVDVNQTASSWASTTNEIAFLQRVPDGSSGIWILPMSGDGKPRLFLESPFSLTHAEFSPDGRWMAYVSNESGGFEVYVRPYPGSGEKTRISSTGGTEPFWSPNGRELFYRVNGAESQRFFSVPVTSLAPFRAAPAQLLFETKGRPYDATTPLRSWNISPDGQRFLLSRFIGASEGSVTSINIVMNWLDELKRRVPAK